jgi:hypothetical protein
MDNPAFHPVGKKESLFSADRAMVEILLKAIHGKIKVDSVS